MPIIYQQTVGQLGASSTTAQSIPTLYLNAVDLNTGLPLDLTDVGWAASFLFWQITGLGDRSGFNQIICSHQAVNAFPFPPSGIFSFAATAPNITMNLTTTIVDGRNFPALFPLPPGDYLFHMEFQHPTNSRVAVVRDLLQVLGV